MKKTIIFLFVLAMILSQVSACSQYSYEPCDLLMPIPPYVTNGIKFHSWEELSQLYDAAGRGNKTFVQQLDLLNSKDCSEIDSVVGNWYQHLDYQYEIDEEKSRDYFLTVYNLIKNRKLLIPKDELCFRMEDLTGRPVSKQEMTITVTYLMKHPEQKGCWFQWLVSPDNDIDGNEGDPIATVKGDGYSALVWSGIKNTNADGYHSYNGYIVLEGETQPSVQVTVYSPTESVPEEFLTKFADFRVTTIEEILEDIDP